MGLFRPTQCDNYYTDFGQTQYADYIQWGKVAGKLQENYHIIAVLCSHRVKLSATLLYGVILCTNPYSVRNIIKVDIKKHG